MNEGGGRGGGGRDSCRPGSREGNGERKWVSIKLCQGQFAVNGASPPGRSFTERMLAAGGPQCTACWEGPVHSKDRHRDKSIAIIIHNIHAVMQIPRSDGGDGDAVLAALKFPI